MRDGNNQHTGCHADGPLPNFSFDYLIVFFNSELVCED
jgi:hypothetical protein